MNLITEKCGLCGACASVCPNNVLELEENEIIQKKGCDNCETCTIVCPLGALFLEVG
ncbi:MAG: 4Fe-4S dicluster domain-containing protein [Euryarchaeota archaeon]|nr:4Fe-4S dicluster domain-containing protein [Euryarchaeota archaeon]